MADNSQQKIILSVDTGNSQQNIDDVKQSADSLKDSLDKVNNTKPGDAGATSFKNFRQAIREANNEAQQLLKTQGQNSDGYKEAAKRVAELKDQQDEYNQSIEAFNPDNKLQALGSLAKGATGAIQGVAGAFTALGVDSKTAEESIARLQGLMAFSGALNSLDDIKNSYKNLIAVLGLTTTATEGLTVAEQAAGVALKSIGIGLIVAAVAYLVSNFDELKETVLKLIPGLNNAGDTFNKIKAVVIGVGNAVIQYTIAPLKSAIDLIHGDFKKAQDDFVNGFNLIGNAQQGYLDARAKQAKQAEIDLTAERVKGLEYGLKQYKEGSQEYITIQKELDKQRLIATQDNEEERLKATQDIQTRQNQERIKAQDEADKKAEEARKKADEAAKAAREKAAQERKAAMDEIAKDLADADKAIFSNSASQRDQDLKELEFDYQKRLDLFNKNGQDTTRLTEAYKYQEAEINKKYDDQINDFIQKAKDKTTNVSQQKRDEINKSFDDMLKNATEKEKEAIEQLRLDQLNSTDTEETLHTATVNANVNVIKTTTENTADKKDDPQTAFDKKKAVLDAQVQAENASYQEELNLQQGNQEQIELLTANHEAKLTEITNQQTEARKELATAEADHKRKELDLAANDLNAFSDLAGKQTATGKALSVASATISTYEAGTKAYLDGLEVGGPYGIVLGIASAAAAVAAGISNVKKILSVKVPGTSDSVSAPSLSATSISSISAPSISAASLNQTTTANVNVTNLKDMQIKAYVTQKDLKETNDRIDYQNKISTF
ncbi:hypothetical protein DCC81_19250 [Chitinophaga parva]|uniref:Uncharacterized protein n=1 Tax=Chitinophaga parva TaxID=2169414 RepID=A0A2T7BJA6_9BACT|nr:hypothetical protein [Chitinophaga parva]PUZ26358.1 hypothetical protein DCC81_19250 [Chitinophaga parva]